MKEERLENCILCNTKLNKLEENIRYCIQCDKYYKNNKEIFFSEHGIMHYVEDPWTNIEQ